MAEEEYSQALPGFLITLEANHTGILIVNMIPFVGGSEAYGCEPLSCQSLPLNTIKLYFYLVININYVVVLV